MKKLLFLLLISLLSFGQEKSSDLSKVSPDVLKKFKVKTDKFSDVTFLHHKKSGQSLYLYIAIKNNTPTLRMVCKYSGANWVFFDKIIFLIDGVKYEYVPKSKPKREVVSSGVYERSDDVIFDFNENDQKLIVAIANAKKNLEVRFSGSKISDQTFYTNDAFLDTYNLYKSFEE